MKPFDDVIKELEELRYYKSVYDYDSDYQTNSKSYYDYLARFSALMKILVKRVAEYDKELAKRFEEWDKLIEKYPENVEKLLIEWLNDGVFDDIIESTVFKDFIEELNKKESKEDAQQKFAYLDNKKVSYDKLDNNVKNILVGNENIPYVGGQSVDMTRLDSVIQHDIGVYEEVEFSTSQGRWDNDGSELNIEDALLYYYRTVIGVTGGSIIRFQYDENVNKHFVFMDENGDVVSNQNYTTWQTNINVPDNSVYVKIDYRIETKLPHFYLLTYSPIATKKELNDLIAKGIDKQSITIDKFESDMQEDIGKNIPLDLTWESGSWLENGNADNGRYATANYKRINYKLNEDERGKIFVLSTSETTSSKIIYQIGLDNSVIKIDSVIGENQQSIAIKTSDKTLSIKIRISNNVTGVLNTIGYGSIASKEYVKKYVSENTTTIPDYWTSHMESKATLINEYMQGSSGDAYIFITDTHWFYNEKNSPKLIEYLLSKTRLNKVVFGGDIVQAYGTKQDMIDYSNQFFEAFSFLNNRQQLFWITGNHDFTIRDEQGSTDGNTLSIHEQMNLYNQPCDGYVDYPYGKSYFYKDNNNRKTRYIFMNMHERITGENDYWGLEYYVSKAQLDWLSNEALTVDDDDWKIIIFTHEPIVESMSSHIPSLIYLSDLFESFNNRSSISIEHDEGDLTYNFNSSQGKIILQHCGHSHKDEYYKSDTMLYVSTGCDARYYDDVWDRTKDTINEHLFDVVIQNESNITFVRIGAGENRILEV